MKSRISVKQRLGIVKMIFTQIEVEDSIKGVYMCSQVGLEICSECVDLIRVISLVHSFGEHVLKQELLKSDTWSELCQVEIHMLIDFVSSKHSIHIS